VRRIRAVAAVLMMMAALTVGIGAPASAQAPVQTLAEPCEWQQFGVRSNCDDQSNFYQDCFLSMDVPQPYSRYDRTFSNGNYSINVQLWYSWDCRTVWAHMRVQPGLPAGSNCYVKIERNYNPVTVLREQAVNESGSVAYAQTNMLDDHGVTSFAWGYCQWAGGPTIRGGTGNW
jgi:hypothetical protein